MNTIMNNSKNGIISSQDRMDSISNNIANVDTNGYKSIDNCFKDVLTSKLDYIGYPLNRNDNHIIEGTGSKDNGIVRNETGGTIYETGKSLDLAINGSGYFRLIGSDGKYHYTRDGNFKIDANGNIVNSSGMFLDTGAKIKVSSNSKIEINREGQMIVDGVNSGKINTYSFLDRDDMTASGDNSFTSDETPSASNSEVIQGHLEKSNVDLADQLTNMIANQRIFSFNSKSLQSGDEMWQIANNIINK